MPHYRMSDGENLFVREYGTGQPVLVLSGLGMHSWQWHPFLYRFRKNFKFIVPDWRGFGGSNQCKIPDLDAVSSHWRDIQSVLEQLPNTKYNVIAYSMGATTAMHGMQYGNFADKIQSYLHIDQTPKIRSNADWPYGLFGTRNPEFIAILENISHVLARNARAISIKQLNSTDRESLLQSWLVFIDMQASSRVAPFLIKQALKRPSLQSHVLPIQRLDYLAWYINNYLHHLEDYRDAICQLDKPTTFFIGEQSKLYPSDGQKVIANRLHNATAVIFKKSGHTPLLSEPFKFSKEIGKFLAHCTTLNHT